jgi:diaminopimelate epimerase
MEFLKMHGLGNDFVIIDARTHPNPITAANAQLLSDRHYGVGCDQVVVIEACADADAQLTFWNADGSVAGACGNATRCVAALLFRESQRLTVLLHTNRGVLTCTRLTDGTVQVDMGPPLLDWQSIPLAQALDTLMLPIAGQPTATSMGNPHCTFFIDQLDMCDLTQLGPQIECHPLFPEKTNVQIVEVCNRREVRARVWERGVGLTRASGSSACALVVAGIRRGLLDQRVVVHFDGGDLQIEWMPDSGVLMSGPVAWVFAGRLL